MDFEYKKRASALFLLLFGEKREAERADFSHEMGRRREPKKVRETGLIERVRRNAWCVGDTRQRISVTFLGLSDGRGSVAEQLLAIAQRVSSPEKAGSGARRFFA